MPQIEPFVGIRFVTHQSKADLSSKIAPPYDVLDADDKARLLDADPQNIVAVDLPHVPPKEAGPDALYTEAGDRFRGWIADGVLGREVSPAIYCIAQTFQLNGVRHVRRGFIARMRLSPLGHGEVFPHEQTFSGPKEDRRKLLHATLANLSPVFCIYPDESRSVINRLANAFDAVPTFVAEQDGVLNEVWVVRDLTICQAVAECLADTPVYIADGHHRYGTSLAFEAELDRKCARTPPADSHPARFVMTYFVDVHEPGLIVLPTHRVVEEVHATRDQLIGTLSPVFSLHASAATDAVTLAQEIDRLGRGHFGVYLAQDRTFSVFKLEATGRIAELEPGKSAEWQRLDLAVLHRVLIEDQVRPKLLGGQEPHIYHIKDPLEAVRLADEHHGMALFVRATSVSELEDVCAAGDLMPQKSTYFYPKIPTGLVFYDLAPIRRGGRDTAGDEAKSE